MAIGTGRRRSMDERERAIIAAHEVGHAICGRVHGDRRRVEEISLFAHGEALGVTVSSQEDNDLPSESDLRARLIALMGGRAAEELLFHEVTGGASNDFEKATQIATTMVTRFGHGPRPRGGRVRQLRPRRPVAARRRARGSNLPSEVQAAATRAIRAILDEAYVDACETLAEHLDTLRRIAAFLVEEERVDGETFEELFEGRIDVADRRRGVAPGHGPPARVERRDPVPRPPVPPRDAGGHTRRHERHGDRRAAGAAARSSRCPSPRQPPRPADPPSRVTVGEASSAPCRRHHLQGDRPRDRERARATVATSGTPVTEPGSGT